MSTGDSRLSAEEQAALAHLEAAAAADDPHLDARLRGSAAARIGSLTSKAEGLLGTTARFVGLLGWWGIPLVIAGLAMIVLAVPTTVWIAVPGALLCVSGIAALVAMVERRLSRRPPGSAGGPGPS